MLPDLSFLLAVLLGLSAAEPGEVPAVRALMGTGAALLVAWAGARWLADRALAGLEEQGPQAALLRLPWLALPAFLCWMLMLQVFGWGAWVFATLPPATWLLRYVVLFLPLLAAFAGAWVARARVEGEIAARLGRREAGPTPTAAVRAGLRRNGLALIPMGVLLGFVEGLSLLATWGVPGVSTVLEAVQDVPPIEVLLVIGVLAALAYALPVALARLLPSEPFPPGPLQARLARLATAMGLAYREMRVWKTGRRGLNAMVVGLTGGTRRIFVTDGLLEALAPEEVEAVFCHEAAHAQRHHLVWFLVLTSLLNLAHMLSQDALAALGVPPITQSLLLLMVLWFGILGWVSRRFERESDVDGGRHAALLDPEAAPHVLASLPTPVPAGAWRMVRALKRLESLVGDVYSHRHGLLSHRAAFVALHATQPALRQAFTRGMRRMKLAFAALAVVLVGLALLRLPADLELGRARADLRRGHEAYGQAFERAERDPAGARERWQAAYDALAAAAGRLEGRGDLRALTERAYAWLKTGDVALRGLGDLARARQGYERALRDLADPRLSARALGALTFEARVDLARVALREGLPLAEVLALERRAADDLPTQDGPEGAYGRERLRLLAAAIDASGRDRERGVKALEALTRLHDGEERWVELKRDAQDELRRWTAR